MDHTSLFQFLRMHEYSNPIYAREKMRLDLFSGRMRVLAVKVRAIQADYLFVHILPHFPFDPFYSLALYFRKSRLIDLQWRTYCAKLSQAIGGFFRDFLNRAFIALTDRFQSFHACLNEYKRFSLIFFHCRNGSTINNPSDNILRKNLTEVIAIVNNILKKSNKFE